MQKRLAAVQAQAAAMSRNVSRDLGRSMNLDRSMGVNLNGPMRDMDELTKRIQRGKISYREFADTINGTNRLMEYQNRLAQSTLSSFQSMGSGRYRANIDLAPLQAQSTMLQRGAAEWRTMGAAAQSYGKTVMDQGKNLAFMGRQALLSITAPIAGIAGLSAMAYYQIDGQLTNIAKVYDKTADGMIVSNQQVKDSAMEMAKSLTDAYGAKTKDTLELAGGFASLGETGRDLDRMTESATRLMTLGDVDTTAAQKMIANLRTVFKLEGKELDSAVDFANQMENSTSLTMQDFAAALPKIGTIVNTWGGDVKEAGMILEAFTRAGIPAVEGANALKTGFTYLSKPTPQLNKMWDSMSGGAETLEEIVKKNKNNVPMILRQIGQMQKAQGWSEFNINKFSSQLWGATQGTRGRALTEGLASANKEVLKSMGMTDEELAQIADTEMKSIMESSSKKFQVALENIKQLAMSIGEVVLPMLTKALELVTGFVTTIGDFAVATKEALGPLGDLLATFGKVGLVALALAGPVMLLVAAAKMISGGLIRGWGAAATAIGKTKDQGLGRFQTADQRANRLAAMESQRAREAEGSSTDRLRRSVDMLSASYQRMQAAAARANASSAAAQRVTNAPQGAGLRNPTGGYNASNMGLINTSNRGAGNSLTHLPMSQMIQNTRRLTAAQLAGQGVTSATTRLFNNQSTAISANNRALQNSNSLKREAVRLDAHNKPMPGRSTITNSSGTFTQTERAGAPVYRVSETGQRTPLSASENLLRRQEMAAARTASLTQTANQAVRNSPVANSLIPTGPTAAQQAAVVAGVKNATVAQNALNSAASKLPGFYSRVQTPLVQNNAQMAAMAANSNSVARIVNDRMATSFNRVGDRIAANNKLQQQSLTNANALSQVTSRQAAINAQVGGRYGNSLVGSSPTGAGMVPGLATGLAASAAATNAANMAAATRTAADNGARFATNVGMVASIAGILPGLFGSTNKVLNKVFTVISSIGLALIVLGTIAPLWIGKMWMSMKAFWASSTVGGSAFFAKMTGYAATFGRALMAALPYVAILAAAFGTIYAVNSLITADSREYVKNLERMNNSAKDHAEILGYTLSQFGQMKNEAGEVVDTVEGLAVKYKENEDTNKGLISNLSSNLESKGTLRMILNQEAVKILNSGGDEADVQQMVEATLMAAGADDITIQDLKVQFKNTEFLGIRNLMGPKQKEELASLFLPDKGMEASSGDWLRGAAANAINWIPGVDVGDGQTSESDLSDAAPARIKAQVDFLRNSLATIAKEDRPKFLEEWNETINGPLTEALNSEDPTIREAAEKKQAEMLRMMSEVIPDMSKFTNNADYAFAAKDMTTVLSSQAGSFRNVKEASTAYEAAVKRLEATQGPLSDAQKLVLNNIYRTGANLPILTKESEVAGRSMGNFEGELIDVGLAAEDASAAVYELNGEMVDKTTMLKLELVVDGDPTGMTGEDAIEARKNIMKGALDDVAEDMAAEYDTQMQIQKRAYAEQQKAESDALDQRLNNVKKGFDERQQAEKKGFDKAQEAEKKKFDDDWEARIDNETKAYDDRIKAIEDTQEVEDDLERARKRNAEREERRLKYLQSLQQVGLEYNLAMAGGNLDEAARISLNAGVAQDDYGKADSEAEAGYAKEDADKLRSKEIDRLETEKDARIEALEQQKEIERAAMEERMAIAAEEFQRRQALDAERLASSQAMEKAALQKRQDDANFWNDINFQADQRLLNRKLEALKAGIPLTEDELRKSMERMGLAWDDHGGQLTKKGEQWAAAIEKSLDDHTRAATEKMSNDKMWEEYGNRVAEGASRGAFNMSAADFNKFLRTGELPAAAPGGSLAPGTYNTGRNNPAVRHAGGPIGGGSDKYNNRGGINSKRLYSSEVPVLAQKGEYMMNKNAVSKYGTGFMSAVNSGSLKTINPMTLPKDPNVSNPKAVGGFGEFGGAMAAITMGSIISRTVEAAGNAMMSASSSGGGDIGDINIPQGGGKYGSSVMNAQQLKTAALIAEAAKEVGASKRDLTIALMTAYQESTMGLNGMYKAVDHTSLGAFQQQDWWGSREERTDIKKSAKLFFQGGRDGSPGLFSLKNRGSMSMGQAAQKIQQSQFPSAYDQWQDEAEALVAAGVGTGIQRSEIKNNMRFGGWTTDGIKKFAENAQLAAGASAGVVGAGGPMNVQPGEYQNPVPGSPISSRFGPRWGAHHDGIDFSAPAGTHIYATKAGRVTFASNYDDGGFGLHTVIDHGGGITSGYAHQSRLGATVGQEVAKGQHIGYVGTTGNSTGNHLHFQLGRGSSGGRYSYTTDPAAFIPGLKVGGTINYDNVLANLHKGETVLTSPLTDTLQQGINNIGPLVDSIKSGRMNGIINVEDAISRVRGDAKALFQSYLERANDSEIQNLENTVSSFQFDLKINAPVYGVNDMQAMFDSFKKEIMDQIKQEEITRQRRVTGR